MCTISFRKEVRGGSVCVYNICKKGFILSNALRHVHVKCFLCEKYYTSESR